MLVISPTGHECYHHFGLWMVYGYSYAADHEMLIFQRLKDNHVRRNIETTPDVDFSPTQMKLGRVNLVDPLGITNLRIRGMWLIAASLAKCFIYVHGYSSTDKDFQCN